MGNIKEDEIKGNISERLVVKTVGAKCPFNNFGPCQTDRCVFFVVTDLNTGDSECVIRASYLQQLLNDITIRSTALFSENAGGPLSEISIRLAVGNLVSALQYLDGLSVDPKLAPHLRLKIRRMKRNLRIALKDFSERKI